MVRNSVAATVFRKDPSVFGRERTCDAVGEERLAERVGW